MGSVFCRLCTVQTLYSLDFVFFALCILCNFCSIDFVFFRICIRQTLYSINFVFYKLCILYILYSNTLYSIDFVINRLCIQQTLYSVDSILWNLYSIDSVLYRLCILQKLLSRPLLALRLGEYWFRISRYVYDHNRPLTPILIQRRCSLMNDVYLLAQMMMVLLYNGTNQLQTFLFL